MDKKNGKKNLFILNVTGQAQKTSRVQQRRLHARAQVHSTVGTRRLGIAPVRYGVVVRASATTSPPPPPGNGKENKKQTNRSRQHSQTILSVTTVHHRLRAHSGKSECRTRRVRTCARSVVYSILFPCRRFQGPRRVHTDLSPAAYSPARCTTILSLSLVWYFCGGGRDCFLRLAAQI